MRTALAVTMLLTGVSACAGRSADVVSPQPETLPPAPEVTAIDVTDTLRYSAPLLRRLAEAVDGYRDGMDRFVVASLESPHQVAGVVPTPEEAEALATAKSTETLHFEVFGPYRTIPDDAVEIPGYVDSVVAYLHDGGRRTYNGRTVDALFWSLPAFDKFIAPYLTSVNGVAEAARQRELYRRGDSPLANSQTVPHYRLSF